MSDFDGWYKEFQTHRQFPMSIEANNQYVARMAYEAGRKAILDTIIDMAIVNWTFAEADEDDAKIMIHKLMCQAQDQAVDPAISKEAQELIERGRIAGLEEAAKICDPFKFDNACDRVVAREIAAAIRERIK